MFKQQRYSSFVRLMAVATCLAMALAVPFSGASAAGPVHVTTVRGPMAHIGSKALTKAQIERLAGGSKQKVIVVLKNQFHTLTGRAHADLAQRQTAISDVQRPVLSELHQVEATNVTAFRIINAISATVTSAEVAHLSHDPAVRAVVPNATIPAPKLYTPYTKADLPALRKDSVLPKCDFTNQPYLEPEALQLTHTAYANSSTPQAQNSVDGAGVTVAIVSGPIDPYNQDFIRSNGQTVITDYEDFSGDPVGTQSPSWNLESFLDMSSIASQGRDVYNANDYLDGVTGTDCNTFRILGMAPGANVMWLAAGGQYGATDSSILQSVQYAVANGANVISESFGGNPPSDTGVDVVSLADQQAVADGVSVVASTGDAGPGGSVGSPATNPGIIAAGATTQEQFRALVGELPSTVTASNGKLTYSKYQDNNIASFSSSGVNQNGSKSVDVVAPGAFGFIDCSPTWEGCSNAYGLPNPYQILGGTSESAPLTAGEVALVDEAYAKTHGNKMPSPALVKTIVTSTATDLGDPSVEQGAGLINSLAAVQAAESYNAKKQVGSTLLTSPSTLVGTGTPGAAAKLKFSVTNNSSGAQTVQPAARMLGTPSTQKIDVNVTPADVYTLQNFTVPKGTQHLAVDEAWNVVKYPQSWVLVTLIGPNGAYNDNTQNSQNGPPITNNGYGHVDVSSPAAGKWTAIVHNEGGLYTGTVHLVVSSYKYVSVGSVSPASLTIGPGKTAPFTLNTKFPSGAGDSTQDLVIQTKSGSTLTTAAGTVPVILRALVPIVKNSGAFSGTIGGGNGRGGALYSTTYEFKAPAKLKDLEVNVKFADPNNNLVGVLVGPDGITRDIQSTVTSVDTNPKHAGFGLPTAYTNTLQTFWRNPEAGAWRFVLLINDNISGAEVFQSYNGTITFNGASVSASGLPDSKSATVSAKGITVPVTIKNTGNTTKAFFIDPRLTSNAFATAAAGITIPPPNDVVFPVPPETSQATFAAESLNTKTQTSQPIALEAVNADGAPPYAGEPDPDLESSTESYDVATQQYGASLTVGANELTSGIWLALPSTIGPYGAGGATPTTVAVGDLLTTKGFDIDAVPSTGDPWAMIFARSTKSYTPLVLKPGATGTIKVTLAPADYDAGTVVTGHLFVDTINTTPGWPTAKNSGNITWSGDEVAALPYAYTVK